MTVRLVPFGPEHDADFEACVRDPEIVRFTPAPSPVPEGYAVQWRGRFEGTERLAFAALDEDHRFAGYAVTPELDLEAGNAELGYAVAPAFRGRGVATQMLDLLTDHVFGLGVGRAFLLIEADNAGSQRVAEKAGYAFEGPLRSVGLRAGVRRDMQCWSRLPE